MRGPAELTGDGVRLRPWRAGDVATVDAVREDEQVGRWSHLPDETSAEWIARQAGRTDAVSLAITAAAAPEAVGKVALGHHDPVAREAELSYWLVPAARGRGLAAAACRCLCGWGFRELGLRLIVLEIEPSNAPSLAVARTLGAAAVPGPPRIEVDRHGVARDLARYELRA